MVKRIPKQAVKGVCVCMCVCVHACMLIMRTAILHADYNITDLCMCM